MTPTSATSGRPANRLKNATSPYLLQHAHNPVDWYEWGPEALEKSKREDRPIFLSIGYSACHWCHVMERESFENQVIAEVMNRHFVCIKVDREERPDLDEIYMAATQALTQSGGWPMSVWLTPDLKPFYAGTYFPPEDRYGRPGFKRVLEFLADAWKTDRDKALQQADEVTQAVLRITRQEPSDDIPPGETIIRTVEFLSRAFDPVKGGISGGGTNKFPPSMAMDLMLRVHHATGEKKPLELVELTLDRMANGGIYDQLGGGIARYSTDVDWLVPHFEKMLYDQALVSDIYLKAWQLTKKPLYARIAGEIFDYAIRDLQGPEGGFFSTRDADSEGVEGKYYVWARPEVIETLGEREGAIACDYYDVTDAGNWEGHNILHVPRPLETVAKLHGVEPADLERRLADSRKRLLAVRDQRVPPHLDDKILASWNGLMIASMAKGGRILNEPRFRDAAARAAEFVLAKMARDGRLLRTYRKGRAHTPGFLDDHAFMIEALLNLYETTFELKWLDAAVQINDAVLRHFRDAGQGGFFFTADDAETTLTRSKEAGDGAVPSGNSIQLMNLLRLSILLDRKDLADEAQRLIKSFGKSIQESPFRSERLLSALDFYHRRPRELAFVARKADAASLDQLIDEAWQTYVPNIVFARLLADDASAPDLVKRIPLLAGKTPPHGKPAAFVCQNYACKAPRFDPKELAADLRR